MGAPRRFISGAVAHPALRLTACLACVAFAANGQSTGKSTWTFTPELRRLNTTDAELSSGTVTVTAGSTDTIRVGLYLTVESDNTRADDALGFDLLLGAIHFSSNSNGLSETDIGPIIKALRDGTSGWTSKLESDTTAAGYNTTFDGSTGIELLGPPAEEENEDSWIFLWLDIESFSNPRGVWCDADATDHDCEIFLGVLEIRMAAMPFSAAGTLSLAVASALDSTQKVQVDAFHLRAEVEIEDGNTVTYTVQRGSTSTAPTVSSGAVNGDTLTLVFDADLDADTVPAPSVFDVEVDSVDRALASSDPVAINNTIVTLKLGEPISSEETLTVAYTQPTNANANRLQLASATDDGAAVESFTAYTVTNNTPAYALSVADESLAENSASTLDFTVAVEPSASQKAITVDYATSGGTATAGEDYTSAGGTLTIAAGSTEGTISVTVTDDTVADGDETFNLTLSNPTGATLDGDVGELVATGTIEDDEPAAAPVLSTARGFGQQITLTYTKSLDQNSTPASAAFTVEAANEGQAASAITVSSVEVSGSAVILTLAAEVRIGQTVTLDYDSPGTDPVQDIAGLHAADLTDQAVTVGPALADMDVTGAGSFDRKDAQAVTYVLTVGSFLETNAGFRERLLASLASEDSPTDEQLLQIVNKAKALNGADVPSDMDVTEDGSFDRKDAQAVTYVLTVGSFLETNAGFRERLLASLASEDSPTDEQLLQIVNKAKALVQAAG